MLIRREQPQDVQAIGAVTTAAFRRSPVAGRRRAARDQARRRLRAGDGWLPALSLVAVRDGAVIGHAVCTRGFVDDAPVLGLAPISVLPDHQGTGVGHALMHALLGGADATNERLVCVLGEPDFYRRLGFRAASRLRVDAPYPSWGSYFQARTLSCWPAGLKGTFRYASAFTEFALG